MLRSIFITLILAALYTSAFANGKVLVKPVTLEQKEFFDQFNAYGECRNDMGRKYYSSIEGTIDFITTKQGDVIKADEVIIAINQKIADAIKSQGKATFKAAESTYNKDKALFDKKIISLEAMDKSIVNFEEAKVKLEQSLKTYNDMVITAPHTGKLGVIKALVGDKVKTGDYLFSFISDNNFSVFLELPETLYKYISSTTEVILNDSSGNKTEGSIAATSPSLSNYGTITTKVAITKGECIQGSYINALLFINKHQGLAVPDQAILQDDKGSFVYKIGDDKVVSQIYIKTGTRTNRMIEVLSDNLRTGDIVVLEGLTKVQNGTVVSIDG